MATILLTNDDGIHAEGLWALYGRFFKSHGVVVVAPDRERSAVGHGITLHQPLRTHRVRVWGGYEGYAVDGTPADCVKIGILEVLGKKPDAVISGINPGANVGVSINYSGTVSAAREAALYGIPSVAVSVNASDVHSFEPAASVAEKILCQILDRGLPFGTLLNVNVPDLPMEKINGFRISRQGVSVLTEYFEKRVDPRNRSYHWLGGDTQRFEGDGEIDWTALYQGYVSITPIRCDMTDYQMLEKMAEWEFNCRSPKEDPEEDPEEDREEDREEDSEENRGKDPKEDREKDL